MASRRMGPKGSQVWHAMLDACEEVLRDLGYGGLSSRTVAERAGVKQRLVYYYFDTMDDLIVETFRRLASREVQRMELALAGNHSLRQIWDVCIDTTDTRIVLEFMALANRNEGLRCEVRDFIELSRTMHVTALTDAIRRSGGAHGIDPAAAAIFAASAALTVHREAQIGVEMGHDAVMALIDSFLARLDPAD